MVSLKEWSLSEFEVKSVTQQIADYLKQNIVYGNIREGEKLPSETEMAEQLNVSRNTIRGALTILVNENLLEIRKGRGGGYYATTITEDAIEHNFGDSIDVSFKFNGMTLDEVIESRRIIEVEAAYLAALRRTEKDLQRLRTILDFLNDEPLTDLLFCKNNYVFNRYLSIATQNRMIIASFSVISKIIVPLFKYIDVPFSIRTTLNEELELIYEAIYNKDPNTAKEIMSQHLCHFENFFRNR